jgi:hypothetical protein
MAGTESERGLDLDADAVDRDAAAVVHAVHDKAAGRDRRQSGEAFADPVLRCDFRKGERAAGFAARGRFGQRSQRRLIGRLVEMHDHAPAALIGKLAGIDQADSDFSHGQALGKEACGAPRRLFIGCQRCDPSLCSRRPLRRSAAMRCIFVHFPVYAGNSQGKSQTGQPLNRATLIHMPLHSLSANYPQSFPQSAAARPNDPARAGLRRTHHRHDRRINQRVRCSFSILTAGRMQ